MSAAMRRAVLMFVVCWLWMPLVATAADPARLKLSALIQEGDLLLEEVAKLEPVSEQLAREGKALDQTESELRADAPALEADIRKYNDELGALESAATARQVRCSKKPLTNALIEACNAEAARLNAENQRLSSVRASVEARRTELNRRVDQFNQARRDYLNRRQAHERQLGPNKTDVDYWVERAAEFIASPDFKSLYVLSNTEPGTCAADALGDLKSLPPWEALRRGERCLRAVKAGLPD
jgi:hypothetical protein